MRFRYLVAVPFEDHGSEVLHYEKVSDEEGRIWSVVQPSATITNFYYELLRPGFEKLPVALLGEDPAHFRFDYETQQLKYYNIPTPEHVLDYIQKRPDVWSEYLHDRQSYTNDLYALLSEAPLECAPYRGKTANIDQYLDTLLDSIKQSIPYLMGSRRRQSL